MSGPLADGGKLPEFALWLPFGAAANNADLKIFNVPPNPFLNLMPLTKRNINLGGSKCFTLRIYRFGSGLCGSWGLCSWRPVRIIFGMVLAAYFLLPPAESLY
jgi:hypothetical protein